MSRLNSAPVLDRRTTYESARAWPHISAIQQLRRSVLSCMLWEDEHYEDGRSIAERITEFAEAVPVTALAGLAIEARTRFKLRHAPLLLAAILARRGSGSSLVSETIARVIQRADELTEFVAIYAAYNGVGPNLVKTKLSAQAKKGLALAFQRFDEYQLAKYDRATAVRLRDVLFLVHAKPVDEAQEALWKRLVNGELTVPDTWEVALSGGAGKKATFERLIREERLGYLALLRNLRNMQRAGCDPALVNAAILARKGAHRVLPFRFIAAAKAAPSFEPVLDQALLANIEAVMPELDGTTVVLIDVSGSMDARLSAKSDMTRMLAAAALGSVVRGKARLFTFSEELVEVPPRRGMAGVDAVVNSQPHARTFLAKALQSINAGVEHDRIIVVTDEQVHDGIPHPVVENAYVINVASAKNGVGYGKWTHIDGFSERVFDFIVENESARFVT